MRTQMSKSCEKSIDLKDFTHKTPCGRICRGEKRNFDESIPCHHKSLVIYMVLDDDLAQAESWVELEICRHKHGL